MIKQMARIGQEDEEMTDALALDSGASTTNPAPKIAQWTRVAVSSGSVQPAPRSGHAMTVLPPTKSVLLFGGSNGRTFFDDFHLLEPVQYAAAGGITSSETTEQAALVWKKLVVSYTAAPCSPTFLSTSFGSEGSSASQQEDPSTGCGRDYHTMHYVPAPAAQQKQRGFRVLVVGNAVVTSAEDEDNDGSVVDNDEHAFESDELRIDEAWIKQPLLEAQWGVRAIKCMWKPRPRLGHCSALLGDQLFCFGGRNSTTTAFYGDLFYFDVVVNQWRELPPIAGAGPSPRTFAAMTACPSTEQLFVCGGHDATQQFGGLYVYDVKLNRWDKVVASGDKPATRINHSLTFVAPHQLLLFGGRTRATRRNDTVVFDMSTKEWRDVCAQPATNSSQCDAAAASLLGRTAHATVVYGEELLVFGGYAGSHQWLNDLHTLPVKAIPSVSMAQQRESQYFVSRGQGAASSLSTASESTTRGPTGQSTSSSSTSSSRPSSRAAADSPHVLSDITNLAPPPPSIVAYQHHNAVSTSSEQPAPAYTPAAVAARKRRLAEMAAHEAKATSTPSSSSSSKTRRRPSSSDSSQGLATSPQLSQPDAIGLQTMLIQLLQHQQRVDENVARLASVVMSGGGDAARQQQHDAMMGHQVFLHRQHDRLESKLDVLTRQCEGMEHKVHALEKDKRLLQEQLVAAETEVYMYKKTVEELLPQLGGQVQGAIEQASREQLQATQLIQAKISNLHELVDEIRHLSGERTESDSSPLKKDSIFPDESLPLTAPNVLYPQTVVRDLERKLHDAVHENHALLKHVAALEARLRRCEGNRERFEELMLAWARSEADETKESESTTH